MNTHVSDTRAEAATPLTAKHLASLQKRHHRSDDCFRYYGDDRYHCAACRENWPCDVFLLLAELKTAQETLAEVNETLILIRGRELEAISRWRGEDVQRYLTQPDYGELLDWLNAERIQAQEERDRAQLACHWRRIERDAAIENMGKAWREYVRMRLVMALGQHTAIVRAEAAERDAKEMGALAERLKAGAVEELHVKDHWEEHCKLCDMMWPVGEASRHEEACPAEEEAPEC